MWDCCVGSMLTSLVLPLAGPLSDLQLQDQDITDARPAFNLQSSVSLSGLDLSNRKAAWSFDRTANALVSDKKPVDLVTFR